MTPSNRSSRSRASILALGFFATFLAGCGHDAYVAPQESTIVQPQALSSSTSGSSRYAQDIRPFTSAPACSACHQGAGGPKLALGTYEIDSNVDANKLRIMLATHGKLSSAQLAKVDSWIQAGRPESSGPGVVQAPVASPAPINSTASATSSIASTTYAQDIQPLTLNPSCKACHQSGSAARLALGNYAVDSSVNADSLRRMIASHGEATSVQLAKFDAWVQAGRPMSGGIASSTPAPTPVVTSPPVFHSPHIIGWKWLHGLDVKFSGGYEKAHIKKGGSCTNCHTAEKLPDGKVPPSPGSNLSCFSCHDGPQGGD